MTSSLTFRRLQTLVATLAIVLVAFAAMVAVCDDCNVLAPDPHCPFCNLANLAMTSPLLGLQFAPPVILEQYRVAPPFFKEQEPAVNFGSPRAPPA